MTPKVRKLWWQLIKEMWWLGLLLISIVVIPLGIWWAIDGQVVLSLKCLAIYIIITCIGYATGRLPIRLNRP